ncbi:unnamed protein product, partial [Anisakis simplex]|uniref:Trithorax group protein osa n=1 Tax=Anisakis simplex TaxID=6269 RepID=A0A0M3KJ77_ANISI
RGGSGSQWNGPQGPVTNRYSSNAGSVDRYGSPQKPSPVCSSSGPAGYYSGGGASGNGSNHPQIAPYTPNCPPPSFPSNPQSAALVSNSITSSAITSSTPMRSDHAPLIQNSPADLSSTSPVITAFVRAPPIPPVFDTPPQQQSGGNGAADYDARTSENRKQNEDWRR